jgi:hypothetical protein
MVDRLPPGLDPVTAGRFGLWLLGQRNHRKAQLRRVSPSRVFGSGLAERMVSLFAPWTVEEYPGELRLLAGLCKVSARTVEDWLYKRKPLPPHHARHFSRMARQQAQALNELADDLDRHATQREAHNAQPRGCMKNRAPASSVAPR